MEKKGTKIAYFIALAIVVIALVIAKVTNDAAASSLPDGPCSPGRGHCPGPDQ